MLAPGLRVGWVVPGRFRKPIKRMKLNQSLVSPTLNQVIVANYLREGTFYRHLRKLREAMKRQGQYCAEAINRHFPEEIRMTAPSGGQSLWIELPRGISGREVFEEARKNGISILPGFLCTSFHTFDRYIRIGYGGRWDRTMARGIQKIGEIIKTFLNSRR